MGKSRCPPNGHIGKTEIMTSHALHGQIIAFEGADGAGKTSLSRMLYSYLSENGVSASLFSFPGKETSELGSLVYNFHHMATASEVQVDNFSLQLLHVAAHIDMLNNHILPELQRGSCVILDRYWWSVVVYGLQSNVPERHLKGLIEIEKSFWKDLKPSVIFLLERDHEDDSTRELTQLYMKLYGEESSDGSVQLIQNRFLINSFQAVLDSLHKRELFHDL